MNAKSRGAEMQEETSLVPDDKRGLNKEHHSIWIDRMKLSLGDALRFECAGDVFRKQWDTF